MPSTVSVNSSQDALSSRLAPRAVVGVAGRGPCVAHVGIQTIALLDLRTPRRTRKSDRAAQPIGRVVIPFGLPTHVLRGYPASSRVGSSCGPIPACGVSCRARLTQESKLSQYLRVAVNG
jgi:hypothetical protein